MGTNLASISYGKGSYGNPLVLWWGERTNLSIGKYCSIANNVEIFLGGNHRIDWITTYPFPALKRWSELQNKSDYRISKGDVNIENDVWIGRGCAILSGVKIGNGAVIGCNAVVTQDVPAYSIAAGNPAKVISMRFPEEYVKAIESIAWWNWPSDKIRNNVDLLLSGKLEEFYASQSKVNP